MKSANIIALACCLSTINCALASDISREVRYPENGPLLENGGYFEIGIGTWVSNQATEQVNTENNQNYDLGFTLAMSGEYRYKNFFIESPAGPFDGIQLGYTFWYNNYWQMDILATGLSGSIHTDNTIENTDTEKERNKKLIERDTMRADTGLRITGYHDSKILQFHLVSDIFDNNGIVAALHLGKHWQYRNWNIHGIIGSRYYSSEATTHFWGINENDATQRLPVYTPRASYTLETEIGVTYPITEHWVFRSIAHYVHRPEEISQSPLYKEDHHVRLQTTITYVF